MIVVFLAPVIKLLQLSHKILQSSPKTFCYFFFDNPCLWPTNIIDKRRIYPHMSVARYCNMNNIYLSNIPTIGGSSNAMLPTDRQCDLYCNLGHIGSLLATYWHAWTWNYYWQEGRRAGAGNMARCLSFGFWTCLSIIPYLPIHINCHYDIFLNIMNTFLIHSSSWWLISYFA